ncbi:hypothetical protein FOA43_003125 [Brettanomyces nanus]|uniref:HECT-type E3 ubiquitin transferase n=1 Tax=Eeniella nana TaxID=13502 RepID=A0A875S600_EENNA|nr:uncharacterized protein FOA43_003125 [Brettanomyces nanus]QPG75765.1 hypothetical protein FOA43_003125 [Brettanomyces nanus]
MPPNGSTKRSGWLNRQVNKRAEPTVQASKPPIKELICDSCACCGTIIKYPSDVSRVMCMVCQTSFTTCISSTADSPQLPQFSISFNELKDTIQQCHGQPDFKAVQNLIIRSFSSDSVLNASFKLDSRSSSSYHSPNLNYAELRKFYSLLRKLPTNAVFYRLLITSLHLLRHPPRISDVHSISWLLILLEIPLLPESLISGNDTATNGTSSLAPQLKSICYDILKRVIGLMAHMDRKCMQYVTNWWSKLPDNEFVRKIDFLNLYITFQLTRCINYEIYNTVINTSSYVCAQNIPDDDINYKDTLRAHFIRPTSQSSDFGLSIRIPLFISSGGRRLSTTNGQLHQQSSSPWGGAGSKTNKEHYIKIKIQQYSDEWHLRTAARVLSLLFSANKNRSKVPEAAFYNCLVDYVNVKQDFDSWQFTTTTKMHERDLKLSNDSSLLVLDYLKAESNGIYLNVTSRDGASLRKPSFTFCQFPFLISLGAKITILEHEAKRNMERKAEEAFIQSINKKIPFGMYFKIRVRRTHVTNDSLRSIKAHQNEFKKLLRVEFVNEPGIDAGGLKKEWFLLLTKELFDAEKGLFSYNETSHLCYFARSPINSDELYYLVGAVLGLAIYNSTILDLKLPRALYKKLMNRKVTLHDFIQLDPETGAGLQRLLTCHGVQDLAIFFEVTYKDIFDDIVTKELIKGGSQVPVTDENKYEYVERYMNFFLNDTCKQPFEAFCKGFYNVVGGNALSLFTPEEIQLILIGDESSSKLDTSIMRSITKYNGFQADDEIIDWFWNYFDNCSTAAQKKLLFFVTGTDRLPATGLPSLHFKITRLCDSSIKLPTSHTCFNELCLYDYQSQEIFKEKMDLALDYGEGFGLR